MPRAGAALDGRPSLDLLRRLSDGHVLGAVLDGGPGSRADLAGRTGLSKPTVGQSVGRLIEAGVLAEGGPAEHTGRGRTGTTVTLAPGAGCGLAIRAGATGLVGEVVIADGLVAVRDETALRLPVSARRLSTALRSLGDRLVSAAPGEVRAVAVSIADPVGRDGRTVHLPGGPFLSGDVDVPAALAALPVTPVVDNDVNWSLLAEQRTGDARDCRDVVQLHLGVGLGAALMTEGRLVRGARGFAGEITYAVTDPSARTGQPLAGSLLGRLSELGLLVVDGIAVDLPKVERTLERGGEKAARLLEAVAGTIRGACHLLDPEVVVLDGPWGRHPVVVDAVKAALRADPIVGAEVRVAAADDGALVGARLGVRDALRAALVSAPETAG